LTYQGLRWNRIRAQRVGVGAKTIPGKVLMLTREVTVSRRARYAVRHPDHSRPHGRRRGYDHMRLNFDAPKRTERGPSFIGFVVIAAVFSFLLLIVAGALTPKPGPLIKHEPVSTARIR
jgi:hypothetical protein